MRASRFLPDGKVFDASNAPGRKPIAFKLGARQVIKGWEEVLRLMNVREDGKEKQNMCRLSRWQRLKTATATLVCVHVFRNQGLTLPGNCQGHRRCLKHAASDLWPHARVRACLRFSFAVCFLLNLEDLVG